MKSIIYIALWLIITMPVVAQYNDDFFGYTIDAVDNKKYITPNNSTNQSVRLMNRKKTIENVLTQAIPVLYLDSNFIKPESRGLVKQIQDIWTNSPALQVYYKQPETGKALLNEIFSISAYKGLDTLLCNVGSCYNVEMYNYATNTTIRGVVSKDLNKINAIQVFQNFQADVPPGVKELAVELAIYDTAVIKALGYRPTPQQILMPGTKTALNRTTCERSRHLCLAPTIVKDEKALWVIVDITDLKVVGLRWTNTGEKQPKITQQRLMNETVQSCNCDVLNTLEKNKWKVNYQLTRSDGLEVKHVTFNGKPIINSAKLVDWKVSYSGTDGFGYSDAVGCPQFSHAAVIAVNKPLVKDLLNDKNEIIGFTLEQSFSSKLWPMPCEYNYLQRFEFYNDGSFKVAGGSLGRGCGNNGTYRPVFRIALAGKQQVQEWQKNSWQTWKNEAYTLQNELTNYSDNKSWFKITNAAGNNYELIPGKGNINDVQKGDNAYVFVTKNNFKAEEGESDLITIAPCCNTDYQQGPHKFINAVPEPIENQATVIWYVAQIRNDNTKGKENCWAANEIVNGVTKTRIWPCIAGPFFKALP
jgi:hypothetical protein